MNTKDMNTTDMNSKEMNTKDRVLRILEENRGKQVSGTEIARNLNISRNAVWKAINGLKQEGHYIDAGTNRGYSLASHNDILSLAGILPFLAPGVLAPEILASEIPAPEILAPEHTKIHVFQEVVSTNTMAKKMAVSYKAEEYKDAHGTVLIADKQTQGYGRHGRPFFSPSGHGIYMSFILNPNKLGFDTPTLITSYTAVTVCEAIENLCGKYPKIKWVNDIFLGKNSDRCNSDRCNNDRRNSDTCNNDICSDNICSDNICNDNDLKKICGISAEAVMDLESRTIQWIVVGIGINFTMPDLPALAPELAEELTPVVGAVFEEGLPVITRNQLAAEIINGMLKVKIGSSVEMLDKYRQRLFILGKKVRVLNVAGGRSSENNPGNNSENNLENNSENNSGNNPKNYYEATALDIDEIGQLIVQNEEGERITLSAGEISIKWR